MTIFADFQIELNLMQDGSARSPSKTITYKSKEQAAPEASTYGVLEFSYSSPGADGNYTIIGGSDHACNLGAFTLLRMLGFRYYWHFERGIVRPTNISPNISRAKGTLDISGPWWGVTDGFNYNGTYIADRALHESKYTRWRTVLAAISQFWPHGHQYQNVIRMSTTTFRAQAPYFLDNPDLLTQISQNGKTVDVMDLVGAWTEKRDGNSTRWNKLVNFCARWMAPVCDAHPYKNGAFDCNDGDTYDQYEITPGVPAPDASSDLVCEFTEAVAAKIRSGAPAIPGYSMQHAANIDNRTGLDWPAIPTARLGILGYSNHSRPPSFTLTDAIYAQVTGAYLFWGGTLTETIDGWAAKTSWPITTYMYPDLILWNHAEPMYNRFVKNKSQWSIFAAAPDLAGFAMEYSPNGLVNSVMVNWVTMSCFDRSTTYEDALAEIVATLYGGDTAVRDLFRYWGDPFSSPQPYSLKKSFDYVYAMQEGSWWKTYFKYYLTIASKYDRLPPMITTPEPPPPSDPYRAALSSYLSNVHAIRNTGILHSYSIIYRFGSADISTTRNGNGDITAYRYPELMWNTASGNNIEKLDPPDWYKNPVTPSDADFDAEYAYLVSKGTRDPNMDDTELVVLTGVPIVANGTFVAKNTQRIPGARVAIVGPGTLNLTSQSASVDDDAIVATGGVHLHEILGPGYEARDFIGTMNGGLLFINLSDFTYRDGGTGFSFIWIPESLAGNIDIKSSNVAYFRTASGAFVLYGEGTTAYVSPKDFSPGIIALDDVNTKLQLMLANINPWVSNDPNVMLAPKAFVEAEFPGLIRGTLVAA